MALMPTDFSVAFTEEPVATYAVFSLEVGWGLQGQSKNHTEELSLPFPKM